MSAPFPAACKLCRGACCEGMGVDPTSLHMDGDMLYWWRMHGEPSAFGTWIPSPCRHLKDGACAIHDQRPVMCRDWKVGGKACRTVVRERRANWREIFGLMT